MSETRVQTVLLGVGCVLLAAILAVSVSPSASVPSAAVHPMDVATMEADGYVVLSPREEEFIRSINSPATMRADAMTKAMQSEGNRVVEAIGRNAEYIIDAIQSSEGQ